MRKKIVITGAAGNLGRKLFEHLKAKDEYELVAIDLTTVDDPAFVRADVAQYDSSWVQHLSGAHAVVHLAAVTNHEASWDAIEAPNVDAALNIFEAAVAGTARRVVFASSVHTMAGYKDRRDMITSDLAAKPDGLYAASKLLGERAGRSYALRHGLSVICLRIGVVAPDSNQLERQHGAWQLGIWLSNRDWCQGAEKAIEADDVDFAILNLTSGIEGSRWDLTATRQILGYEPTDGVAPMPTSLANRIRSGVARWKRQILDRASP
jgi:nucleoside-diphosphate-sugar epimerase